MSDDSHQEIYKAVVLAKLMYASPAWCRFTAASDRQQIDALVRRGVRFGLYNAGDPTPSQIAEDADDSAEYWPMNITFSNRFYLTKEATVTASTLGNTTSR